MGELKDRAQTDLIEAIQFCMKHYGHSQAKAAQTMGIASTHFNELLRGKRRLSRGQLQPLYEYGIPFKILMYALNDEQTK